jgi:hypothetical protein
VTVNDEIYPTGFPRAEESQAHDAAAYTSPPRPSAREPAPALFYPNRLGFWKVRLLNGGQKILATTDLMSVLMSRERRHFIDSRLVLSLPNGAELMAGLLPPDPPCTLLSWTQQADFERVLGMLPVRFAFVAKLPLKRGRKRLSCVTLDKVLVVEQLPVPLHVSINCLMDSRVPWAYYSGTYKTTVFDLDDDSGGDDAPATEREREPGNSGIAYVTIEATFQPTSLPVEYRQHAYWVGGPSLNHAAYAAHFAIIDAPPDATQAATMEQSLGLNSADAVHCFMCASQVSYLPLTIVPLRVRTCVRGFVCARSRACARSCACAVACVCERAPACACAHP